MPAGKKRKLRAGIIGSGRLGTALALALDHKEYSIEYLVARRLQNARKAAALLDASTRALAAKHMRELSPVDLVLIATPDDQIAKVANELAGLKLAWPGKATVLHTSGALSSRVLAPLGERGWSIGSLHPLVSVSDPRAASLRGGFWCVEGDRAAVRIAKTVVRDLEGKSFSIGSEYKPLYHAAAVMSSGNVVALFDVALEMLGQCGLRRKEAQRVLLPLLITAIGNLRDKDPANALTGPFSRGDVETVKRHLTVLKHNELKDALELYRLLGQRSLKLSKRNSPQIGRLLKSG